MKIKLQDYSLISNEWIDAQIKSLTDDGIECLGKGFLMAHVGITSKIKLLQDIKKQLIPSEKLADVCYDTGWDGVSDYNIDKDNFLTSEIEIL